MNTVRCEVTNNGNMRRILMDDRQTAHVVDPGKTEIINRLPEGTLIHLQRLGPLRSKLTIRTLDAAQTDEPLDVSPREQAEPQASEQAVQEPRRRAARRG